MEGAFRKDLSVLLAIFLLAVFMMLDAMYVR